MKPDVLFLLHLPPAIHGSAIVGLSIKESLKINQTFDGRYINLLLSSEVNDSGNLSFSKLCKALKLSVQLTKMLFKKKPVVCYFALTTTGTAFFKDFILIVLLKLFRVRIVYHLHNKGFAQKENSSFHRMLFDFAFKDSKVIILSKHLYSDIAPYVSPEQVEVCPNGVARIASEHAERTNAIPRILFLSNLIKSKGVIILLEACVVLKDRNWPFQCTIAGGDGDISGTGLYEMIRLLDLTEHVSYVGSKFDEEKDLVFKSADIFVFPTYYSAETFGLVNVEAMQYRLPVVSTFEGGIPDIVEDGVTGFLVPQRDVIALADKLEVLLADEELRKRMGEAGYRKYENEFTQEKFENRLIEILQHTIEDYSADVC
jgi:glycosyltransferase involved in cell wall biosynthesis